MFSNVYDDDDAVLSLDIYTCSILSYFLLLLLFFCFIVFTFKSAIVVVVVIVSRGAIDTDLLMSLAAIHRHRPPRLSFPFFFFFDRIDTDCLPNNSFYLRKKKNK